MTNTGEMHECIHAQLCPTLSTLWAVAHQAPPSMGFSKQEYWRGLPFSSPGDLPYPGIELMSPESPVQSGTLFTAELITIP